MKRTKVENEQTVVFLRPNLSEKKPEINAPHIAPNITAVDRTSINVNTQTIGEFRSIFHSLNNDRKVPPSLSIFNNIYQLLTDNRDGGMKSHYANLWPQFFKHSIKHCLLMYFFINYLYFLI